MAPDPAATPDPLTVITLTHSAGRDDDATAHGRTWIIPAEWAEQFAAEMTRRFGEPACEQVTTVAEAVALAERPGSVWISGGDDA